MIEGNYPGVNVRGGGGHEVFAWGVFVLESAITVMPVQVRYIRMEDKK